MKTWTAMTDRTLLLATAALALGTAACDTEDSSIIARGLLIPDDECSVTSDDDEFLLPDIFDTTSGPYQLTLYAALENQMTAEETPVDDDPETVLTPPNAAMPLRFDFRWECDSNGFSPEQGPLYLPQFSLSEPFCLDQREDTETFVGRDAVSASGPAIEAGGGIGVVTFQPVPPQLGYAFDEVFQIATQSNACCTDAGGCGNVQNASLADGAPCKKLQDFFDAVSGGQLSARSPADVQRWQPYSLYVGGGTGSSYPIRMRGRFELVTASGRSINSTQLAYDLRLCRGCAQTTSLNASACFR